MTPTPAARRAFTLLEMLAATAMVAALAASLYASLHMAFKARDTAMRSLEPVRKCAAAISLLKNDLQSALPPGGTLAGDFVGQQQRDAFGQESDTLLFYTATADVQAETGAGDIAMVEFACEQSVSSADSVLVRRVTTNLLAPTAVEPPDEVICRGVRSLALRYFDGSAWQESWDSNSQDNVLPVAVEVTIELSGPSASSASSASFIAGVGYKASAILLIPCGQPVADAGTTATGTTATGAPSGGAR